MPGWLQRYLDTTPLRTHLWRALGLGLFFRLVAAYFIFGPIATDCYLHGLMPARDLYLGNAIDIPEWRSPLLVWVLAGIMAAGGALGIEDPLSQVRLCGAVLGVCSLLTVVGGYWYASARLDRVAGGVALYLLSLHFVMPLLGTRFLGETICLPLVMLGFGLCERALNGGDRKRFMAGALLLGSAALFRFQAGLLYVAYGAVFLARRRREAILFLPVGLLLLAMEAAIDLRAGRAPLSTLLAYFEVNRGGGMAFGATPWHVHLATVLGLVFAPFSIALAPGLFGVLRRHARLFVPLAAFVAAHTMMPHREERFMAPILGILLLILAAAWALHRGRPFAARFFTPVCLSLNAVLLVVLSVSNHQETEFGALMEIRRRYPSAVFLQTNTLIGKYFLVPFFNDGNYRFEFFNPKGLDAGGMERYLASHAEDRTFVFVARDFSEEAKRIRELAGTRTPALRCLQAEESASLIDRLAYRLNPRHNDRRRAIIYLPCERT